ncbi:MAG: anti-sigma factor [Acidobacteria bacterium]|nr:anti-sigma factor [Acidobacteriota bacterium]
MMTTDEAKELIPFYALGALDVATAHEIESYLRQASPPERREADEFREIAALLPYALSAPAAPAALRDRLMNTLEAIEPVTMAKVLPFKPRAAQPVFARPRMQWLAAAAALVMTFGTAYFYWQNQKLRGENLALTQQVAAVKAEQQAQIEQVLAPLNRILTMKGVTAQQASAKIVWDVPQQRWLLQVYDLPAPPSDKDYQLWYVTKDAKLSAAVFRPDARGRTTISLNLPANVNAETLAATAVTLEPKGGVPQPTGQFYLLAQL